MKEMSGFLLSKNGKQFPKSLFLEMIIICVEMTNDRKAIPKILGRDHFR